MKQYLLMCDESGKTKLESLLNKDSVEFLEVQGMTVQQGNVNVLVTPILPPVNPMPVMAPVGLPTADTVVEEPNA